jgi:hypothetical protein
MHKTALRALATTAILFGCASQPLEEKLQPSAVEAAQQRGVSELACPEASTQVLSKRAVEEAQSTGWYEAPRRAEYTVGVSGCGKQATYLVTCNRFHSACQAGPLPAATGSSPLSQLADELQPSGIKAAQQRGSKDLACPAATAEATRKETIIEPQMTGWGAEAPHRAVYAMTVKGCGKQTAYLVECDKQKNTCATAGAEQTQAGPQQQLADDLQPGAVQVAQERGAKELDCPSATTRVSRRTTIEEGQMTGWYEAPYRVLYVIDVAGCGRQTSYLVACNKKENRCAAGTPGGR